MRMRAAVLSDVNQPLSVEEVELAPPQEKEVLVRMVASGVCHSDLHVITGDLKRPFPVILGHEGAGIVEDVGPGVTKVKPGDHVVLTYLPACGKCQWCHRGFPNMCDKGALLRSGRMEDGTARLHRDDGTEISNFLFVSTWAEYSVVPQDSMVPVPDWVPLERACLFGCGFTTGFGAATNALGLRPGESLTVVGCGGLGLAAIQGARLNGVNPIIGVDLYDEKLEMARHFGATHTVKNPHDPQAVIDQIMEITWGRGTDASIEVVGTDQAKETLNIAFHAIRKGGTMCLVGVGSADMGHLPIDPYTLTIWRKKVIGVLFGDAQFHMHIPRYIHMMNEGQINMQDMVTREYRLDGINEAVQNVFDGNKVARQVIRFD